MRQITPEFLLYVHVNGRKRRVYRTERKTNKETPYFYIDQDGKSQYLSKIEIMWIPEKWLKAIPIRNN